MTSTHRISASARANAAPGCVYAVIANYRDAHPRILPKQFSPLIVEAGGIGAGTIIRFHMRVFGRTRSFRAAITEPEPGRVLVETDLNSNGAATTFTVDPGPVHGESDGSVRPLGAIERYLTTKALRRLYVKELALLAAMRYES